MDTNDHSGVQELLIRIDERVKSIQEDISTINCARRCESHAEKLKNLERSFYGVGAILAGLLVRIIYEAFPK